VSVLIAILTLLLLAAVIVVVSAPLRSSRRARELPGAELGALEAARDAKYREIRDAELDYRTGKLSREDYEALSASLRAEAVAILDRLAEAGEKGASRGAPEA
jgi:hypothetical protein